MAPQKVITSIDPPETAYSRLTKGTILEPWLQKALLEGQYLGKPINVWTADAGLMERIGRASHVGAYIGLAKGIIQGYFYNVNMGYRGGKTVQNTGVYKTAAGGFVTGFLMSTAFTVGVSGSSYLRNKEEDAIDWYLGGLASGLTVTALSQVRGMYYSKQYNMASVFLLPLVPCFGKYFNYFNEYHDDKVRFQMGPGSIQQYNAPEKAALYGIHNYDVPLEEIVPLNMKKEMMFLKPRKNPAYNDTFRAEE